MLQLMEEINLFANAIANQKYESISLLSDSGNEHEAS